MNDGMAKKLVRSDETPKFSMVNILLARTEFLQNDMEGGWPKTSLLVFLSMPYAFCVTTTRINETKGRPSGMLAAPIRVDMQGRRGIETCHQVVK